MISRVRQYRYRHLKYQGSNYKCKKKSNILRRRSSIDDDILDDDLEKESVNGNISKGHKIEHSSSHIPMNFSNEFYSFSIYQKYECSRCIFVG